MSYVPTVAILALTSVATAAVSANTFVGYDGQTAAAGTDALGIADYDAATGDSFAITVLGTQRVKAGGAFNAGDQLQVGPDGKAVVLADGKPVAKALQDSAGDGAIVTVLRTP